VHAQHARVGNAHGRLLMAQCGSLKERKLTQHRTDLRFMLTTHLSHYFESKFLL
jgi:hypothetical protein